ncbi:MAG: hypothetical protein WA192_13300 [Candidatus Acidiferrales bacterium]
MPPRERLTRRSLAGLAASLAALGLCAFQYGDRYGLNSMPFAQVQPLAANLAEAQRLASEGNIDLFAGQAVPGKDVELRGELTDGNCYLGTHTHAYDHAFCAKLCVAAGSPLVFVPDAGGPAYVVLTARNATRLPAKVLDEIGVPGIVLQGKVLEADGVRAFAVRGLGP